MSDMSKIPCKTNVKYLGMRISAYRKQTIAWAKNDIKRYLHYFSFRLRACNNDVKEHLVASYGASLLRYLAPPLLGAMIIKEDTVKQMEA